MESARSAGAETPDRARDADPVFPLASPALLRLASLLSAFAVGLILRSTRYFDVFTREGQVLLGFDDALFAARRGLYSFVNFPEVLGFDPFIAYPDGAASPVPPLFGWAMAAVARLFGDDTQTFETVAAWTSPLQPRRATCRWTARAQQVQTPRPALRPSARTK